MVSTDTTRVCDLYRRIHDEISKIIVGKNEIKESIMLALLAGGHLLIEGPPGSAKTMLARSFAKVIELSFKRIQFTPDMMPADITGFCMYTPEGKSSFVEGPIFANVVLADELNRTTPRTQSALLEAMQEKQVTIDRRTRALPRPFMVIATQVMTGGEGTYPLTDVQVDRFLLRILSRYPEPEEEKMVISNIDRIDEPEIQVVATFEEIIESQSVVKRVHVAPDIAEYIVSLVNSLRSDPDVVSGPGTRSSIALYKCARAMALLDGRDYVIPDDIKHLAPAVIEHRLRVRPEAEMDDVTPSVILQRALEKVPVPRF
ncbi:MAG: MoxR family ATPase [Dehalococcoidales bacterium]|nr:MoxR family ATPase [Dehalococcoidales bacterium]